MTSQKPNISMIHIKRHDKRINDVINVKEIIKFEDAYELCYQRMCDIRHD